jgi:DNA replication protein DnaC
MTVERSDNNANDELRRKNDELLKKREELKAEALKEYRGNLAEIKQHLAKGDYAMARQIAGDLSDISFVFGEIIRLFQEKPEIFHCNDCGKEIEGVMFREKTLTWRNPQLCDACAQKEKENEIESQKRSYANFVERKMPEILKIVGVQKLLFPASFENFPPDIVQICKRAVTGKHGLYIWGGVGRGKTWLAVALLKELIKTLDVAREISSSSLTNDINQFRKMYRFISVPSLLMEIKSSYDINSSLTEQGIIQEYTKIPVLILDDIGSEKPTEWVRERLNMIIYERNLRGLKTIYTSNLSPDELQERLDERITSRIHQQCEIIQLGGPDRRRQ